MKISNFFVFQYFFTKIFEDLDLVLIRSFPGSFYDRVYFWANRPKAQSGQLEGISGFSPKMLILQVQIDETLGVFYIFDSGLVQSWSILSGTFISGVFDADGIMKTCISIVL